MDWNWWLLVAAVGIGFVVGLTGMGGGALMTPVLVLFFGVSPLAAVSSDLIASAAMKPFGSAVHMRHGTVHWRIVLWLVIGSAPAAFCGALVIQALGPIAGLQEFVKAALGVALLLASAGLIARAYIGLVQRTRDGFEMGIAVAPGAVKIRPVPTLIVGLVGGLMVGLTSVGSGSLIIIALMALYPLLSANRLVGTDLVQAVPLVIAAAVGHLLFGDVDWSVALPLCIGSIPGVLIGAQFSSKLPGGYVRRALAVILLVASAKLLGVSNEWTLVIAVVAILGGTFVWMLARRSRGLPALWSRERRTWEQDGEGRQN